MEITGVIGLTIFGDVTTFRDSLKVASFCSHLSQGDRKGLHNKTQSSIAGNCWLPSAMVPGTGFWCARGISSSPPSRSTVIKV
jgi:hypothetical protein